MLFRTLLLAVFYSLTVFSQQNPSEVLFTVGDTPVYTDEFIRVYNKNRDIVSEENKLNKAEYLDLFINYKLKLQEAYDLGYDTIANIKDELAGYREQLIQPYLRDSVVLDSLVKEAYVRKKYEINASHILVKVPLTASPADTLVAYQKILAARKAIIGGKSFETVAKSASEDPSVMQNGGNLGYFSVFDMVYPFENAAYTTKEGEVSAPFRTEFGYHIVKVNDKRPSKGEVSVAHIMITDKNNDSVPAIERISDIYGQIKNGDDFKLMARRYSEDKASAANGGQLPRFSGNKMVQPFSDIAFGLERENDISEPFETKFGWHIVKLLRKYPVTDFESMQKEIKTEVEKSDRFGLSGKSIINKLRERYKITVDKALFGHFAAADSTSLQKHTQQPVITIEDRPVLFSELLDYASERANTSADITFENFKNQQVLQYYKDHLEETNKNFGSTVREYKDGLMLFALLQDKIWKKAEHDTVGLKIFYKVHLKDYFYKKRAEVIIGNCTKEKNAKTVQKYLKQNWDIDRIKKKVNEGAVVNVIFNKGVLEEKHSKLPSAYTISETGVSDIFKEGENSFTVVKTDKILSAEPIPFKKIKGKVINDYQRFLEKKWIEDLKHTYPVRVNQEVLEKLTTANEN